MSLTRIDDKSGVGPAAKGETRRRVYRQRADMPDPSRPAGVEANRKDTKLSVRVEKSVRDDFETAVDQSGLSRKEAMTRAIELFKKELESREP